MPAAALVDRFRGKVERLGGGAPIRLGVAVSGGPDSLALLLLAHAAWGAGVEAATVDHGLRAESAGEAAFVADLCARIGCPHAVLPVDVPPGRAGVQGEARRVRYAALAAWAGERGLTHLATAHHADDQAETLLMRLQRGSGAGGLAGIRPVRREGELTILRPLLGWTKAELEAIVAAAGVAPVDDRSNRDERFDRARMRRFLAENPQFEPVRLARTAASLADADQALNWTVERLLAERCVRSAREWRIAPGGLPRELRRRLLARALAELRRANGIEPEWRGGEDVESLLATLEQGGTGTLAGVLGRGGPEWTLAPAPPRRR